MGNNIQACCCGADDKAENKDEKEPIKEVKTPFKKPFKHVQINVSKRTNYIVLDPEKPNLGFKSTIKASDLFGKPQHTESASKSSRKRTPRRKREPENDHPSTNLQEKIEIFARVKG